MMKTLYHIATRADWDSAQESGEYRVESLETQGFYPYVPKCRSSAKSR